MRRRKQPSYYATLTWLLADLILILAGTLTISGLFTPLLSFSSQHPLQAILTFIAGLLLLGTLWFTVNLFKKQKSKAKHLTEEPPNVILLSPMMDSGITSALILPESLVERLTLPNKSARRSDNLLSQQEIGRKLQIELVKSWIKEDPMLKEELKSIIVDGVDIRPLALQENVHTRSLEERLLLLEKQLDEKGKHKKNWMDLASAFYNLAYIIVAVPIIVGLIISLIHLLGH